VNLVTFSISKFPEFLEAPLTVDEKENSKTWFFYDFETNKSTGVEISLKFIEEHIQKEGPYDGFLGFSQGAMMIPLILSTFNPKLKFCILIGPNYFKGEAMREMIQNKIETPSLFFSGATVSNSNSNLGRNCSNRTIGKINEGIL
jgi:hypothetical protein